METLQTDSTSYLETYFEVVTYINHHLNESTSNCKIELVATTEGKGGIYELATEWTDKFEKLYQNKDWDGDYFDTLEFELDKWNFNQ